MKKMDLSDRLLILGCASVVTGVALLSIPAALIAAGIALIAFGVLVGKKEADAIIE
jgi:hypothetical protein